MTLTLVDSLIVAVLKAARVMPLLRLRLLLLLEHPVGVVRLVQAWNVIRRRRRRVWIVSGSDRRRRRRPRWTTHRGLRRRGVHGRRGAAVRRRRRVVERRGRVVQQFAVDRAVIAVTGAGGRHL